MPHAHLINIMLTYMYIFPSTQKTSSKPKSLVFKSYCDLDSENTLSQCIITGAREGTRCRLGMRQLSVKL